MLIAENFVVDRKGKKVAVMLPINEYEKLREAMEELDDIKAYDKAKKRKSEPIPAEQAFREIEASWRKKKQ